MTEYDYEPDDEERVEDAIERVEELGLDGERVAATAAGYIAGGTHPVDAIEAAVDSFDLSDVDDEMEAVSRISARERWS